MKPKYWTITILASAAIIASLLYYLRQPAPYSGPVVVPHVVKTQSQATTTSQTDLQGWQTYTNPQIGLSFEYPPQWTVNNTSDSLYFTNGDIEVLELATSTATTSLLEFALQDIANNNCSGDHIIETTSSGTLFTLGCSATSEDYDYVFNSNIQGTYVLLSYHDDFDENLPESQKLLTLNKIISSLQFTTPTPPATSSPTTQAQTDTSGWQTYTNSQYGFSFEYPSATSPSVDTSNTDLLDLKVVYNNKTENNPYLGTVPAFAGFEVQVSPTNFTDIQAWLDDQYAGRDKPDEAPTFVNGIKGIAVNEVVTEGGCDSGYSAVINNGYAYKIIDCSDNESGSNLMFNSFKFTK